jgi:NAD(P)H-dependent FMN reductase
MRVMGIAGSLRCASYNRALPNAAAALAGRQDGETQVDIGRDKKIRQIRRSGDQKIRRSEEHKI